MIYLFMVGVLVIFLALAIAPALNDTTNQARDSELLNCSSDSISAEKKAVCTSIDAMLPYFIGIVVGLAVMLVGRSVR